MLLLGASSSSRDAALRVGRLSRVRKDAATTTLRRAALRVACSTGPTQGRRHWIRDTSSATRHPHPRIRRTNLRIEQPGVRLDRRGRDQLGVDGPRDLGSFRLGGAVDGRFRVCGGRAQRFGPALVRCRRSTLLGAIASAGWPATPETATTTRMPARWRRPPRLHPEERERPTHLALSLRDRSRRRSATSVDPKSRIP